MAEAKYVRNPISVVGIKLVSYRVRGFCQIHCFAVFDRTSHACLMLESVLKNFRRTSRMSAGRNAKKKHKQFNLLRSNRASTATTNIGDFANFVYHATRVHVVILSVSVRPFIRH